MVVKAGHGIDLDAETSQVFCLPPAPPRQDLYGDLYSLVSVFRKKDLARGAAAEKAAQHKGTKSDTIQVHGHGVWRCPTQTATPDRQSSKSGRVSR